MLSRRSGIIVGVLGMIVIGFVFVKPPSPHIVIAAEDLIDLGGYTITNTILSAWVVIALLSILTFVLYRRLRNVESALVPHGLQNVVEALLEAFFGVCEQVAGTANARRFFPVVATIFVFLLVGNMFGLFPWNNAIGKTIDERAEYLEHLEQDAADLWADLGSGGVSVGAINNTFANFYLDPIPVESGELAEADEEFAAVRAGELHDSAAAVRTVFQEDPIPADTEFADLQHAVEERLEIAGLRDGHEIEEAVLFNLPLSSAEITDSEIKAAVLKSGGLDLIPLRAENFEFDAFKDQLHVSFGADGGFAEAVLFESTEAVNEENSAPPVEAELAPVTVNMTHLALVLKQEREGVTADEGVGVVFPFFRSIATDLNMAMAIALWSFIFVQIWAVQSMGFYNNLGRFGGFGAAAVVRGPIGVFVGLLEVVSEIARVISFSFRLFGNIFAGEVVLFMAAFLVPFMAATVFYGMEVFVGLIQAFVFAMLTLVFAVTAVSHAEHDNEDHAEHHGNAGS